MLHGMDVMLAVVGQAESRPIIRPVTCLVLPIDAYSIFIWVSDESYSSPQGHHQVGASPIGSQCLVIHHPCVYSAIINRILGN